MEKLAQSTVFLGDRGVAVTYKFVSKQSNATKKELRVKKESCSQDEVGTDKLI